MYRLSQNQKTCPPLQQQTVIFIGTAKTGKREENSSLFALEMALGPIKVSFLLFIIIYEVTNSPNSLLPGEVIFSYAMQDAGSRPCTASLKMYRKEYALNASFPTLTPMCFGCHVRKGSSSQLEIKKIHLKM